MCACASACVHVCMCVCIRTDYKKLAHRIWRLVCPQICEVSWQVGGPGDLMVWFQSGLDGLRTIGVTVQFQSKGRQDPGELRFQFESKDRKRLIPQFENSQAGRVFSLTQKRVSLFILFGNQLIGQGPPTAQGSNLLDLND